VGGQPRRCFAGRQLRAWRREYDRHSIQTVDQASQPNLSTGRSFVPSTSK
jgi:hypothetical protein